MNDPTDEFTSRSTTRQVAVTIYYLEMLRPIDLRPRYSGRSDVAMVRGDPPLPALNRFFYATVGADWYWMDRLPWSYQQWHHYLHRPELETWFLTVAGLPAGYYELEIQNDRQVEIAYFGLLPSFIGDGLGSHLLTSAIERGWVMGARRVWVHTCSLDHPRALANYQARGFQLYKVETETKTIPSSSPEPWPGSHRKRPC